MEILLIIKPSDDHKGNEAELPKTGDRVMDLHVS
jgi:hypothetical protein